jgi:hypothetical protein
VQDREAGSIRHWMRDDGPEVPIGEMPVVNFDPHVYPNVCTTSKQQVHLNASQTAYPHILMNASSIWYWYGAVIIDTSDRWLLIEVGSDRAAFLTYYCGWRFQKRYSASYTNIIEYNALALAIGSTYD